MGLIDYNQLPNLDLFVSLWSYFHLVTIFNCFWNDHSFNDYPNYNCQQNDDFFYFISGNFYISLRFVHMVRILQYYNKYSCKFVFTYTTSTYLRCDVLLYRAIFGHWSPEAYTFYNAILLFILVWCIKESNQNEIPLILVCISIVIHFLS